MLQQLDENLWIAEMTSSRAGFQYGARMTVIKLSSGVLWIHSPIELSSELKNELDELGNVVCVLSPTRFHYMHMQEFADAYPEAKYYAPPRLNINRLPKVKFTARLKSRPEPEWENDLKQLPIRGSALYDEVEFFHPSTRTLILTDLLFNIPSERGIITCAYAKALGVLDHPGPSPTFRLSMRNRNLAHETIQNIIDWDFDRVILAHGDIVESGGHEKFYNAFKWLLSTPR